MELKRVKPKKPKRPPLADKRVIPTVPNGLRDAYNAMTDVWPLLREALEPSPPETMADLLDRVCTTREITRDTWAADHGFSRSNLFEFLKDGEGSRVKKATQSAIGKAIIDDATTAGLI